MQFGFFRKRLFMWMLLLALTLPSFYTLIRPGFFPMQDDLQAFRIHQMDKCFQDFQIPCRWVPDMGYQYGYPQFNYYSPGIYYIGEVLHILGFQFIDAVKFLFILGFVFAAFSMMLFLQSVFGIWPALVGSVMYTYVPFKAAEVFVRGSLSEFWAFVFFPLIFWAVYRLISQGGYRYMVYLAFSLGGLFLTHNLMSFIFMPVLFVWAVALILNKRNTKNLVMVALGIMLGFLLAGFFVIPLIFERGYVHLETLTSGYFDYRQHFVSLRQLFLSNYFGYGSSVFGLGDEVSLSVGFVHWIMAAVSLGLAISTFHRNKAISIMLIALGFVGFTALFMMHQRSSFIWSFLGFLKWLQFPWRFLALTAFISSVLAAGGLFLLRTSRIFLPLGIFCIAGVIILHAGNFAPKEWLDITDEIKFSGQNWEKQLTISIFDYLPIYAKLPPPKKAPEFPEVLEGQAEVLSYRKGSNFQHGEVMVKDRTTVRLPMFDFPGMVVRVDGTRVEHKNNDCRRQEFCLGLISLQVTDGNHIIDAAIANSFVRSLGNGVSILIFIGLLVVFFRLGKI